MPDRDLVINPSEEQIGTPIDLAGGAGVTWTNLGAYRELFLETEGTHSNTDGMIPYLTVSSDNFISEAGSYAYGGFAQEGASVGAVAVATTSFLPLTFAHLETSAHKSVISLAAFNVAAASLVQSSFTYFRRTSGIKRRDLMDGYPTVAVAFNSLRFGLLAGTFTRGRAVLRGRR